MEVLFDQILCYSVLFKKAWWFTSLLTTCTKPTGQSPEQLALGDSAFEQGGWIRWTPDILSNLNYPVILYELENCLL